MLEIETSNVEMVNHARLNRAIAYLQLGQLPEAKKDYTELQKIYTNSIPVFYGLGEHKSCKLDNLRAGSPRA